MTLKVIGDVHAGKKFIENVPLHRRGEREALILEDLQGQLNDVKGIKLCVQVGDLFDAFKVDNETLIAVANIYQKAAEDTPDVTYVILRGNHDASRDADKVSSFEVLRCLLHPVENIIIPVGPTLLATFGSEHYGFLPWEPFRSAKELATQLVEDRERSKTGWPLDAVFCHCDIQSFGGDDTNLLPLDVLKEVTSTVYTGHVHNSSVFTKDGVQVVVTGSMQPYSHGEDPEGIWYTTLTFEQFTDLTGCDWLKNKYLKVLLKEGQEVTTIPDCLGFITKRMDQKEMALEDLQMDVGSFNARGLLNMALEEYAIPKDIQQEVMEKFDAEFAQS
jgi:DNA repair exonuclease SbcCD nuclease subunit